jgi:secreted trypsin-like serine protease
MKKPRIINGKEVLVLRYPYFSLMYGRSLCGGVLIGPRLVLSAAHCEDASTQFRIGAFKNPNDGEKVNIRSTIVHPDYEVSRFDNDIIIFQLETDVDLPYIRLGSDYVRDGSYTVIGFGDTDKGQDLSLSPTLQEVELEYVDSDKCDDGHGDRDEVKEDMLCAAGKNKDSCIGEWIVDGRSCRYHKTLQGIASYYSDTNRFCVCMCVFVCLYQVTLAVH